MTVHSCLSGPGVRRAVPAAGRHPVRAGWPVRQRAALRQGLQRCPAGRDGRHTERPPGAQVSRTPDLQMAVVPPDLSRADDPAEAPFMAPERRFPSQENGAVHGSAAAETGNKLPCIRWGF